MSDIIQYIHYDRYIDLTLYGRDDETFLAIRQQAKGYKPGISISYKRVPGSFTYSATVTIKDFFCNFPIYNVRRIAAELGYFSGDGAKGSRYITLDLNVFFAYRPTASPNGDTVFECIVGSASDDWITRQPYKLIVAIDPNNTVRAVLDKTANESPILKPTYTTTLTKDLLDKTVWSDKYVERSFNTEFSFIEYLHLRLIELAKPLNHGVQLTLFNNEYHFVETDLETGNPIIDAEYLESNNSSIPLLSRTTNVTWTAGTLSVVAPFDPSVHPGTVFKCSPNIYTGNTLPVIVAREQGQKSQTDCYYCLLQTVEFSTVGSTNQMTILAVPVERSPESGYMDEEKAKTAKYSKSYLEGLREQAEKQSAKDTILIELGSEKPAQDNLSDEAKSAWDKGWTPNSSSQYVIYPGDTLSDIANGLIRNPTESNIPYFKERIYARTFASSSDSYPGFYLGFPLIALATYTYYVKNNKPADFLLNPAKPDFIVADNKLIIPTFSSYTELNGETVVADLLDEIVTYYEQTDRKSWCAPTKQIAKAIRQEALL